MSLEAASFINQLQPANPTSADSRKQGDDHLRLIKNVLKGQFPNLGNAAVLPSAVELNYVDGVTSAIQTQLTALATGKADASALAGYARFDTSQLFTKQQAVTGKTLTVTAGQTVRTSNFPGIYDLNETNNLNIVIQGNFTLMAPDNESSGRSLVILLNQSGGPFTMTISNAVALIRFQFGAAPQLTQIANAFDILTMYKMPSVPGFFCSFLQNVKAVP